MRSAHVKGRHGPGRLPQTAKVPAERAVVHVLLSNVNALPGLDFPVDGMLRRPGCCRGFKRADRDIALVRHPVGLLDGAQPGSGDPGLAGGVWQ